MLGTPFCIGILVEVDRYFLALKALPEYAADARLLGRIVD